MKLFLTFLLIISCQYLTTAQTTTGKGPGNVRTYDNISAGQINDDPFILGLVNYGSEAVISGFSDSHVVDAYYNIGQLSMIYGVSAESGNTINLTVDAQFSIAYYITIHAIFVVNYDPTQDSRKVLSYSWEWQNNSLRTPSGINVSYDASKDQYQVINFSGFDQALSYQTEDLPDQTTKFSGQDFLQKFANWSSLNTSDIYHNQTLQYAFSAALRDLRDQSVDLGVYDELNVSVIHSIDSYTDIYNQSYLGNSGNYFRYDFEFNTANQSGRAVGLVYCPIYHYFDTYEVENPAANLTIASDGAILSTLNNSNIGVDASYGIPEGVNSSTSYTGAPFPPTYNYNYYYNTDCLYGHLKNYWFVEIKGSA